MRYKLIPDKLIIVLAVLVLTVITSNCTSLADVEHHLTILHTNDVHGRLESFYYKDSKTLSGGIARRAALIQSIKNNNKYVLTVDSGDVAQGTLFFKFFSGIPEMNFMSYIGYDAAVPGNHEFDRGLDVFAQMLKTAKFPFVCANIDFKNSADIKLSPYIIKDYGDFKVGIIGIVADNLKTKTSASNEFKVLDSIKEAKNFVKKIKPDVDLIVVLSHQGVEEDIKLAKAVPDIDIIVGGHTHTFLTKAVVIKNKNHRTLIVQDGELGVFLGRLDLKFVSKHINSYDYRLIPVDESIKEDKYLSKQVSGLSYVVHASSSEVIGKINFAIDNNSSDFLNMAGLLVNSAIKQNYPDADIIFQNNGGLRIKKYIHPGNITKGDIFELFPFDNKPVFAELSGREIKSILETSATYLYKGKDQFLQTKGISYSIDLSGHPQIMSPDGTKILKRGNRIRNILINGKPLNYNKYYKIVANNFIFNGGDEYIQFKKAKNIVYSQDCIQDLIVKYIKNNSPLDLKIQDKINIIKENNVSASNIINTKERLLYGT